jgi:hypothetical protein
VKDCSSATYNANVVMALGCRHFNDLSFDFIDTDVFVDSETVLVLVC